MKKILLIGDPVEHSLSPAIQNAAFKTLGLPFCYEALKIPFGSFEEEIHKVFHSPEVVGANITTPFKELILPFVDPDPMAKELGAVNAVVRDGGRWLGRNTDVYGAEMLLRDLNVFGKNGLILGKGGAGRAASYALRALGGIPTILSRKDENWPKINKLASKNDLIINATGSDDIPLEWGKIPTETLAIDLRYYPLRPRFLKEAEAFGHISLNGLQMLLFQGAKSFEIWTGKEAPLEVMREHLLGASVRNHNSIPGGKNTP
ncbi:shikimate dehydrogenase family protein [Bdellovibrionota bacterium]